MFASEVGTTMSGRNLYRAFKIRLRRGGVPETLRFHDLRHTCATLLLRQGVNPKFVGRASTGPRGPRGMLVVVK